jgi:hypothetical protein
MARSSHRLTGGARNRGVPRQSPPAGDGRSRPAANSEHGGCRHGWRPRCALLNLTHLTLLVSRRAPRKLRARAPLQRDRVAPVAEDDVAPGCGWFDSSHELQQGLLVREHSDPDAVAAEMPLGPWLDLHLGHWRPTLAA